jgi:hypothetical protein
MGLKHDVQRFSSTSLTSAFYVKDKCIWRGWNATKLTTERSLRYIRYLQGPRHDLGRCGRVKAKRGRGGAQAYATL